MKEKGFTIVELVVVLGIMGVLVALTTLEFSREAKKAQIEKQVTGLYSDLMNARSQALMQKDKRTVTFSGTALTVADGVGNQVYRQTLAYALVPGATATIEFDSAGMASGLGGTAVPLTLCVAPVGETPANVDGIVIDQTMIQTGKITGGTCDSDHIEIR